MRITLGTNVLISALIVNGRSKTLLFMFLRRKNELVLSKEILAECAETARNPKIQRYVNEEDTVRFLRNLGSIARIIRIKSKFRVVREDPDDDVILRTAHDGKAKYIVSGDRHLLELGTFRRIRIVTVDERLRILRTDHSTVLVETQPFYAYFMT